MCNIHSFFLLFLIIHKIKIKILINKVLITILNKVHNKFLNTNKQKTYKQKTYINNNNNNNFFFIYIISYDVSIYYSMMLLTLIISISSYISMLFIPIIIFFLFFPLSNPYLISNTTHQPEYLYISLLLFITLEILLFIAYFWIYFHNYSSSYYPINQHILMSSNLYIISGLILSLLSIYLSITLLILFIILTTLEFNNTLDILYINDNSLSILQLNIIFLHLLHLIVGIILILLELVYPHYYHFIEVIWLLIGYCIYLN
jgi:hypothetical protein